MDTHTDLQEVPLDIVSALEKRLGRNFTEKQRVLLGYFFEHGDLSKAAEQAEYSNLSSVRAWFRQIPGISEAIKRETVTQLSEGVLEAVAYLRATVRDPTAPRPSRNDAAKTLLNRAGLVEHKAGSGATGEARDLSDMSPAELAATIGMLQAQLEKKGAKPPIDGQSSPVATSQEDEPPPNQ